MDGLQVGFNPNPHPHFGCGVMHEEVMVANGSVNSFGN